MHLNPYFSDAQVTTHILLFMSQVFSWPRLVIAFTLLVLLSGCTSRQTPDPSMTAVAGRSGGAGAFSPDWISPEDVARAEALGLNVRDSAFSDEEGERIEGLLPSVYFQFDQSFVRPEDRSSMQEAADFLQRNPEARLIVEGHCDWRGTSEYNMALGDRRARSVRDYILQLGISEDRIETISHGDLQSESEASDSQMAQDRRADLVVVRSRQ